MKLFLFFFLMTFLTFSCSSDDDPVEADPILGTWVGGSDQVGLGTIEIELSITTLMVDAEAGRLSSALRDLSTCDPEIFVCEAFTCDADWIYEGRRGASYLFTEIADPGSPCVDRADIEVSLVDDNTLRGTVSFDIDPDEPVVIETNQITLIRK